MLAIIGGGVAALAFAASNLASTRSSRLIGAVPTVGWVVLVGLPIAVVAAASDVSGVTAAALPWLAAAGIGNVVGLLLTYTALRVGQVGIVAPLVSAEGAIAAVISVLAGGSLSPGLGGALGLVVVGGALTAAAPGSAGGGPDESGCGHARTWALSVLLAVGAAIAFGISLYATARIGRSLPVAWAMLAPRVTGAALVAAPLALTRRLHLSRAAAPTVLVSGLAEVIGFLGLGVGARSDIAVTAVLASQFAAVAAVGAVFLFGERLRTLQRLGIVGIAVGAALVALLQA
jgi:drug/metabolite transporter (DMT)-like permease